MLLRTVTAVVLLAGFLAALFLLPPLAFAAVLGVPVAIAAVEWARLCGHGRIAIAFYAAATVLLFGAGALLGPGGRAAYVLLALFAAASVFWCIAVPAWLAQGVSRRQRPGFSAAGIPVLVAAGLALVTLDAGLALYVLAIAWIADTGAYFAGRAFGRRRLAPSISPGKTVEGALGGIAAVLVYAIICGMVVTTIPDRLAGGNLPLFLTLSVVLGALSVLGDLYESALKRQAAAKDSGTLLPGHGGVLDRIDSATAVLPVAAFAVKAVALGGWA